MVNKEVLIFPYINIERIIKMDDFEIHPYKNYPFNSKLTIDEKNMMWSNMINKEKIKNSIFHFHHLKKKKK